MNGILEPDGSREDQPKGDFWNEALEETEEVEMYEGIPEGKTSHPKEKRGLYCHCGQRVKRGGMLEHWAKKHNNFFHAGDEDKK